MSLKIDYKSFIEDNFIIKNKDGELVPFIFNDTQDYYYNDILLEEYPPDLQGVRENILKFRQPGFSSEITGIFAVDFILSELGEIPIINSDVYSHKDDETKVHIQRFNMFIDSWLLKDQGGSYLDKDHRREIPKLRKHFLKIDNEGELVGKTGAEYHAQTASARVSGRGGTKQNIHWSEVAFYPNTDIMNAETLVTGAEEQVPHGRGKIFRETTGNSMVDFFAREYRLGKDGDSEFKSRFLGWFIHKKEYTSKAPAGWEPPEYYNDILNKGIADINQCYWHYTKTRGLSSKKRMRENPTYEQEAFISGGTPVFDRDSVRQYMDEVKDEKSVELPDHIDKEMFTLHRMLRQGEFIVFFVDTAGEGSDYNAGHGLSKTNLDIPITLHYKGSIVDVTPKLKELLIYIKKATGVKPVVAYETNNGGGYELDRLDRLNKEQDYIIYYQYKLNSEGKLERTDKKGWNTNSSTRPELISGLTELVDNHLVVIYSSRTVNEMPTFVKRQKPGGWRAEAEEGANDDLMMSLGGAWQLYQTENPPAPRRERTRAKAPKAKFHI